MRRFLLALWAAAVLLAPSAAFSAAAIDATVSNSAAGSTSVLTLTTTTADTKVFVYVANNNSTLPTIADTAALSWTRYCSAASNDGIRMCRFVADAVSPLVGDTITITSTGSTYLPAAAVAVSGASGYLLSTTTAEAGVCANPNTTVIASDGIWLYGSQFRNTATPTVSSGWTGVRASNSSLVQYLLPAVHTSVVAQTQASDQREVVCDALYQPAYPASVVATKVVGGVVVNQPGGSDTVGVGKVLGRVVVNQPGSDDALGVGKTLGRTILNSTGLDSNVGVTKVVGRIAAQGGSAIGPGVTKVVVYVIMESVPGGAIFAGFP